MVPTGRGLDERTVRKPTGRGVEANRRPTGAEQVRGPETNSRPHPRAFWLPKPTRKPTGKPTRPLPNSLQLPANSCPNLLRLTCLVRIPGC